MDNRERLKKYLREVARVFNKNGPIIKVNNPSNNFTTLDVTDQFINNTIEDLLNKFNDRQIKNALNSPTQLDDMVIMLIHKISGNNNEPLWSSYKYGDKYFLIPSDEAIDKYNIQSKGQNGNFLYSDFEIQPLQPPKKTFFGIFQGGKKSKRRIRTKSTFSTFKPLHI